MEWAIIHRTSGNIPERHVAKDILGVEEEYVKHHPELGVDTPLELETQYPVLCNSLLICPIH